MKGQPLRLDCQNTHRYVKRLLVNCFFILSFLTCFSSELAGQTILVTDSENQALAGVYIYNEDQSFTGLTDQHGELAVGNEISFPVYFQYLGYQTTQIDKDELVESFYKVTMIQDALLMNEVVLIGRTDIPQNELAYESTSIAQTDIQLANAQTTADALASLSNVYVQKSQMGGGSPIVRGFEANKLLLVVDGVRMNNAIYRSGHLQNAITVDPAILDNMEVIFGPSSIMYGSDALGGVVHFQTKALNVETRNNELEGSYYARYGSSNGELSAHLDLTYYKDKWAVLTSFTVADYGDQRVGQNRRTAYESDYGLRFSYVEEGDATADDMIIQSDDPLRLVPTGYRQYDGLLKAKFQASDRLSFTFNNQFSTSSNIPRYDALTETRDGEPRYSSWYYGPQNRALSSITSNYLFDNIRLFKKVQWIAAYQHVTESRISSNFGSAIIDQQDETLNILNITVDFSGDRGSHRWFVGIDGNFNDLNSTAFTSTYQDAELSFGGLTRYANDLGRTYSAGAYGQYYWIDETKPYRFNAGIRYDYNEVQVRFKPDDFFTWPDYFYDGITNRNHALNGAVGFQYKLPKRFKLRGLLGSSFRAPNIDDIAKTRISNDEISVPNADLSPERSYNVELSLGYETSQQNWNVTAYYTRLKNTIIREDFQLLDGSPNYVLGQDTLQVVANVNAEQAYMAGLSLQVKQQLGKGFDLDAGLNILRGNVVSDGEIVRSLSHIPPTYGRLFIDYNKKRFTAKTGVRFNALKPLDRFGDSTDNPEFATAEGSLAWYTLHLSMKYEITPQLQLQLGIDNILDHFYVPFASGIPGMGRHLSFTVRGIL